MRAGDELRARATADVGLKNPVRIVEIGDNQIELGKIVDEVRLEFAVTGEKAGQRSSFDGLHPIDQPASEGQFGNVRVSQDFQKRLGKVLPQRRDRRQRKDEITDRAAANDQNLAAKG